jgi:hypothetical protein
MDLKGIKLVAMDWIRLAQVRGQWRALFDTVINLPDP